MKAPFLFAVALAAVALAEVGQAGPINPLYLTYTLSLSGGYDIAVVQANSIEAVS
jgi:hypothetical protein